MLYYALVLKNNLPIFSYNQGVMDNSIAPRFSAWAVRKVLDWKTIDILYHLLTSLDIDLNDVQLKLCY